MTFQCPQCNVAAKSEAGLNKHIASAHSERQEDEILVDGRKRIKTVQDEFTAMYPFLGIHFFAIAEHEKSKQGASIVPLGGDLTLASVRTRDTAASKDVRFSGRMHVGTLEGTLKQNFGLLVQVCTQKEGRSFYTPGETDKVALSELNRKCEQDSCSKWSYAQWRK